MEKESKELSMVGKLLGYFAKYGFVKTFLAILTILVVLNPVASVRIVSSFIENNLDRIVDAVEDNRHRRHQESLQVRHNLNVFVSRKLKEILPNRDNSIGMFVEFHNGDIGVNGIAFSLYSATVITHDIQDPTIFNRQHKGTLTPLLEFLETEPFLMTSRDARNHALTRKWYDSLREYILIVPVKCANNEIYGLIVMSCDVTDYRVLQESVTLANDIGTLIGIR